ncbi:MAG: RnfH family protein [Pseudomonadota bacterium]
MHDGSRITVSVVHAEAEHAFSVELSLSRGATVADAIERSGIRDARPGIEIREDRIGIFSRKVSLGATLRDGDRVEIYRSLKIDPKEARRKRARRG